MTGEEKNLCKSGNECRVAVIGAGASGIMAAIAARKMGADVVVIERNAVLGKKIAATGNGRCNFTNAKAADVSHYTGGESKIINEILSRFNVDNILGFFDEVGITPVEEDNGKYFPLSGQAMSVVECLFRYAEKVGVRFIFGKKVEDILLNKNKVKILIKDESLTADRVIIATGGMAAPDTGSDGFGYEIAGKMGHTVSPLLPVIVQMKTKGGFYKRINGVRINAAVKLVINGMPEKEESGDLMFFDYGLSGPPVFQLSTMAAYALKEGKRVLAEIDMALPYSDEDLFDYIKKRCKMLDVSAEEMLIGFINKKLIQLVLDKSGVLYTKATSVLSDNEILSICNSIKHHRVEVIGTKSWENAQATAGGILMSEIDSHTLKSKIDDRVSFCGEVLDVVGECGGYNLTWAWASGYAAGIHVL